MITVKTRGSFKKLESFLRKMNSPYLYKQLEALAQEGTNALSDATPIDSGVTAASWYHEIEISKTTSKITWCNSHVESGVPIVILLQYGHGTGTGGYVQGEDFINPALKPIFTKIADKVWEAVVSA